MWHKSWHRQSGLGARNRKEGQSAVCKSKEVTGGVRIPAVKHGRCARFVKRSNDEQSQQDVPCHAHSLLLDLLALCSFFFSHAGRKCFSVAIYASRKLQKDHNKDFGKSGHAWYLKSLWLTKKRIE